MGRILQLMMGYFTKNPDKIATVSRVAGKKFNSPSQLVNWAKGNKINMAMTAANMGTVGMSIADMMTEAGDVPARALQILEKINFVPDELEKDAKLSLDDIDKYTDELAMIRRVAARVGGMSRLLELRSVLALSNQYFELEQAVTRLSR